MDNYVKEEEGTGVVHQAPYFGAVSELFFVFKYRLFYFFNLEINVWVDKMLMIRNLFDTKNLTQRKYGSCMIKTKNQDQQITSGLI